jgi:hypothetical protein
MCERKILVRVICWCLMPVVGTETGLASAYRADDPPVAVAISLDRLHVTDRTVEVAYQIRNLSERDVWLCERVDIIGTPLELYYSEDTRTLVVRRRLDVPIEGTHREQPIGRYVRLAPASNRTERMVIPLPVRPWNALRASQKTEGVEYAQQLAIEIGFYSGNLPETVLGMLEEAEEASRGNSRTSRNAILQWCGGSVFFSTYNENECCRKERVLIPWTNQSLPGEHVLRLQLDGLRIPYVGQARRYEPFPFDLNQYSRLEITYQPSMLEYFFPYPTQRSLLNPEEQDYLRSQRTIVNTDPKRLRAVADEAKRCYAGGLASVTAALRLICVGPDDPSTSLVVYDNGVVQTTDQRWFTFPRGLPTLSEPPPHVIPFGLRMRCAGHLRDLWYRFRLYFKVVGQRSADSPIKRELLYPPVVRWCDETVQGYLGAIAYKQVVRPYRCPSAREGKCHYAMNRNCKPNSPGDMVLLFETKAGWNQHGGPELFTFDNHEPRGGCVLLNDGTVKFIRTEEELHALRWE